MSAKKLIGLFIIAALSFCFSILYLGPAGILGAIFWSILVFVLGNLEEVLNLRPSIWKLLRPLGFPFEKKSVKMTLESSLRSGSKMINKEGPRLLPHGVHIKWVKPMEREVFLEQGRVVVCLERSQNEDKNLARATLLYVAEDLIRESQRFIDPAVMKSTTFATAKKMLMTDNKIGALKCLGEEFIEPEAKLTPLVKDFVPAMERMDEEGHMTRVLLREFSQLGPKLSPAISNSQTASETVQFVLLLKTFEERKPEQHVNLDLKGRTISASLMPVARAGVDFDHARYVKVARICFKHGIGTMYVLARGMNVILAKTVARAIEQARLYTKLDEWEFKIRKERGQIDGYVAAMGRIYGR